MGRDALGAALVVFGDAVIAALILAAATAAPAPLPDAAGATYRIVPLACTGERLAVSGGGVLRLAPGTTCAGMTSGRALTIGIDPEGRAVIRTPAPGTASRPVADIPRAAYVLAPAAPSTASADDVVVTIEVAVPARTPAGDDIYLSTERGGWSPTELRMDRIDARHFRVSLRAKRGARIVFRISRGSYASLERDAARTVPPPHAVIAAPDAIERVIVPAWADVD